MNSEITRDIDVEKVLKENEILRLDNVECHMGRDILATLYEAARILPICGTFAIVGAAIQEIQALREMVKYNVVEDDTLS